jgi:hypothetical protein
MAINQKKKENGKAKCQLIAATAAAKLMRFSLTQKGTSYFQHFAAVFASPNFVPMLVWTAGWEPKKDWAVYCQLKDAEVEFWWGQNWVRKFGGQTNRITWKKDWPFLWNILMNKKKSETEIFVFVHCVMIAKEGRSIFKKNDFNSTN